MTHEIEAHVRRCRTRARMALFVRSALTTSAVASTLAALWMIAANPSPVAAASGLGVSVAVTLVVAIVWTLGRSPSLYDTADEIDRVFNLQNRVNAALHFANDGGPMTALIVRDAWRRVHGTRPADVFPLRAARPAIAAVLCLTGALLAMRADVRVPFGTAASDTARSGFAVAGDRSAQNAGRAAEPTTGEEMTPNVAPPKAIDSSQSERGAGDPNPGVESVSVSAQTHRSSPREATVANDTKNVAKEGTHTQTQSAAASNRDMTPTLKAGPGDSGRNVANATAGTAGGGAGPGAAASSAAAEGMIQSGGVRDGSPRQALAGDLDDTEARSDRPTPPLATRAALRARAEAALTRDDIPPSLRRYVRDFFLRLPAVGTR
jgi:hypothetical protein